MNPNVREHPADLKAKEILFAVSTNSSKTTNCRNHAGSPTSSVSSRRSSINIDFCYEYERRKRCDCSKQNIVIKRPETCPRCDKNNSSNNAPILSSLANSQSLECEKELRFIRAVIWMKSIVKMMEEVSENDIKEVFGPLLTKNICTGEKRQYRIPDVEEPSSPTSPIVSFCEGSSEHISNSEAMDTIGDSGIIVLFDSFNTTSKCEFPKLACDKDNNVPQSSKAVHASEDTEDEHVNKKLKRSELTLSSTFLSSLIENLHINNFVVGEIRIILRVLEKNEIALNYNKNGLNVRHAVNIVVQFLNQLETQDDMSSSSVFTHLCIEYIMATIEKILKSRDYGNLNGVARYSQLIIILEFCGCRKVCEKIIDLLVNSLTELTEMIGVNLNEYEDCPMMSNDAESHLLCHILLMAVKKYCDIVRPSGNINENSQHNILHLWRKLWKNHKKHEISRSHVKDLKIDWIDKLEKLINPQFPIAFSMIGDCKAILKAIKMLSTPTLSLT